MVGRCEVCGERFYKENNAVKYCCNECFVKSRRQYKTVKQKEYRKSVDN